MKFISHIELGSEISALDTKSTRIAKGSVSREYLVKWVPFNLIEIANEALNNMY